MIFFYDLDDFADRTMVLLTTMLVVATLMVGIQSVSTSRTLTKTTTRQNR